MKFIGILIAYLFMAFVLGYGILLAAGKGSFALLAVGVLGYLLAFAKLGCLPPKSHH
jgi:hypothetical protein